jgi:hypothetical protein
MLFLWGVDMSETECRWSWCKPDKPGLWWYGGYRTDNPSPVKAIHVLKPDLFIDGWWAYIGPVPPGPLPPKRKVTQTLWMVPTSWTHGISPVYTQGWFSAEDKAPVGSIETKLTREVEL